MFSWRNQHQIRRFITFQGPAKNLCHHQTMFVNQTQLAGHRIFRAVKYNISVADSSQIWITSTPSVTFSIASTTFKNLCLHYLAVTAIRNPAAFAAIRAGDFCIVFVSDFLKFPVRFHSKASMLCPFEKSKTFFKEIYHPLRK